MKPSSAVSSASFRVRARRCLAPLVVLLLVAWTAHLCGPAHAADAPIAAGDRITVRVLFDGEPLRANALPEFSCRDETSQEWFACRIEPADGGTVYSMPRPSPGHYMMHVEIDENIGNPARFPGDYDVFQRFEVSADSPPELRIEMARLLHTTAPWDNDRPLEGMLTSDAEGKPAFETPRYAFRPRARVTFAWEPVVAGAEYEVVIVDSVTSPYSCGQEVARVKTAATEFSVQLPPSAPGHMFEFGVVARHQGRQVGTLFTHDSGSQGWTFRFRVRDRTVPWWVWLLAIAGLVVLVFVLRHLPRRGLAAAGLATLLVAAVLGGWWFRRSILEQRRRQQAVEEASAEAAREAARARVFLAAWESAVPKPPWFGEVSTDSVSLASLSDLLSVWQSGTNDGAARRRFFKLAYQAVLDHPNDQHLVVTAISLMRFVTDETVVRRALVRFWIDHFFDHQQRTDNCANCMPADQTADVVRDEAERAMADGEPTAAIRLIERLRDERLPEVSPWSWAETVDVLARARWLRGERDQAVRDIEAELKVFGSGWHADRLRQTLLGFREQMETTTPVQVITGPE